MAKKYPGVYARHNTLWIKYADASGEVVRESTKLLIGKEKEAAGIRAELIACVSAAKRVATDSGEPGPVTVESYGKLWVARRKERGIFSARDDENRFKKHVNPRKLGLVRFGTMVLSEIRPVHIRGLIDALKTEPDKKKRLAPRSIRAVYGMLHTMFVDAKMEGLITSNPCELPRGILPKMRDKDPLWRATALFTVGEVEQLISDPQIAADRRVLNAILFLAGLRWGEMAALRWREYEPKFQGNLGRLVIARSFHHKTGTIKATKTEVPRWVPMHPTLAKILAEWKLSGWAQMIGRSPTADDFIMPDGPVLTHSSGVPLAKELQDEARAMILKFKPGDPHMCRVPQNGLRRTHSDCALLGIRPRRSHDARRTFISLARAGGAAKDLLEWITHGAPSDVIDSYTTLPWETLCEQVMKRKITVREGKLLKLCPAGAQVRAQVEGSSRSAEGNLVGATGFETLKTDGWDHVDRPFSDGECDHVDRSRALSRAQIVASLATDLRGAICAGHVEEALRLVDRIEIACSEEDV